MKRPEHKQSTPHTAGKPQPRLTSEVLGWEPTPFRTAGNLTAEGKFGQNHYVEAPRHDGRETVGAGELWLGELKNDPEFVAHVNANLWETRRERGLPWRMDVFEFIEKTYGPWIRERNMAQADLIGLDDTLYAALRERLSRLQPPPGFYFPTRSQASLDSINDPREKLKAELVREAQRERVAAWRAKRRTMPQP